MKKGVSLIEMLVYVALISVIFLLIINTVLSFSKSYRQLAANRAIEHTAINVLERVTRDIRSASSISIASTTEMTLTQENGSVSTTTRIYLQGGIVKVDVNNTYIGPLSVYGSSVTSLTLTLLPNASGSQAIKVDMTVQGTSGPVVRTKNFHSTIIAKGS